MKVNEVLTEGPLSDIASGITKDIKNINNKTGLSKKVAKTFKKMTAPSDEKKEENRTIARNKIADAFFTKWVILIDRMVKKAHSLNSEVGEVIVTKRLNRAVLKATKINPKSDVLLKPLLTSIVDRTFALIDDENARMADDIELKTRINQLFGKIHRITALRDTTDTLSKYKNLKVTMYCNDDDQCFVSKRMNTDDENKFLLLLDLTSDDDVTGDIVNFDWDGKSNKTTNEDFKETKKQYTDTDVGLYKTKGRITQTDKNKIQFTKIG